MEKNRLSLFILLILLLCFFTHRTILANDNKNITEESEDIPIHIPESGEETKVFLNKFSEGLTRVFPGAIKKAWQKTLGIWNRVYQRVGETWNKLSSGKADRFFSQVKKEIEKRRVIFKQELEKEIQEIKNNILNLFKKIISAKKSQQTP